MEPGRVAVRSASPTACAAPVTPGTGKVRSADREHVEEQPGQGRDQHGQPERCGHGLADRLRHRRRERQRGPRGLLRRRAGQGRRRRPVRGGRTPRRLRRRPALLLPARRVRRHRFLGRADHPPPVHRRRDPGEPLRQHRPARGGPGGRRQGRLRHPDRRRHRQGLGRGESRLVRRLYGKARLGWEAEIESQGLVYNKTTVPGGDTRSYWREDVFYDFTSAEIDRLAETTDQLFAACVEAGELALSDERLLDRMRIPRDARDVIRATWEYEPPSIYGRFDLWWDGVAAPRLLEFNADTPTSLVEAAVVQWAWHLETGQGTDQWNHLDDRLVEAWRRNLSRWEGHYGRRPRVHLAWTEGDRSGEDWMTVAYLADCVQRAGYEAIVVTTEEIGLDTGDARFYDSKGKRLDVVFKLYSWEWLLQDEYGPSVVADLRRPGGPTWIEPIWKMLWSNKGLLPLLWQRYEHDPVISRHLLPAFFADDPRAAELRASGL